MLISELHHGLVGGDLSATSLAQACIEARTAWVDPLHAYIECDDQRLLEQAGALDDNPALLQRSVLAGLPASVKSAIKVDGFDLYAGCAVPLPGGLMSQGALISVIRKLGVLISGITESSELSAGGLGLNPHRHTPRNPWDPQQYRVAGGSSAGAAISLLGGSCLFAIGTDTGGSVRVPASYAGIVGLKPTTGRWPVDGVVPLASRFDTIGLLTHSVADMQTVFNAIDSQFHPPEIGAEQAATTYGRRSINLMRASGDTWQVLDAGVGEAIETALASMVAAGYRLAPDDDGLFDEAEALRQRGPNTAAYECRQFVCTKTPAVFETLSTHVREFLDTALEISESTYQSRVAAVNEHRAFVRERLGPSDILVLPTVKSSAPTLETLSVRQQEVHYSDAVLHNTVLPSLCNLCAVTIPVGLDDAGLPVGLQLAAGPGREHFLLQIANDVEQVLGTGRQILGSAPMLRAMPASGVLPGVP